MPTNVNCVYNDREIFCTNGRIPKPVFLGWLLGRRCPVALGDPCAFQVMHPRPEPPKASVPPPAMVYGKSPVQVIADLMYATPGNCPGDIVATCPQCQRHFLVAHLVQGVTSLHSSQTADVPPPPPPPCRYIRESDDKPLVPGTPEWDKFRKGGTT